MTLYDIIIGYIRLFIGQANKGSLKINYRLMRAIVKKWPEYCDHFVSKSEYWTSQTHLEALLPTGAKLVKTRRQGKVAYFLYSYHYSGEDLTKILQSI